VKTDLGRVGFMNFFKEQPETYKSEISFYRTGYTGEDGFEISVPHEDAE